LFDLEDCTENDADIIASEISKQVRKIAHKKKGDCDWYGFSSNRYKNLFPVFKILISSDKNTKRNEKISE
jgi:hypothetical protein